MDKLIEEQITRLVLEELTQNEAEQIHDTLATDPEAMDFYLELFETVENTRRQIQELSPLEKSPKLTDSQKDLIIEKSLGAPHSDAETSGSTGGSPVIIEDDKLTMPSADKAPSFLSHFNNPFFKYILPSCAATFALGFITLFSSTRNAKTASSQMAYDVKPLKIKSPQSSVAEYLIAEVQEEYEDIEEDYDEEEESYGERQMSSDDSVADDQFDDDFEDDYEDDFGGSAPQKEVIAFNVQKANKEKAKLLRARESKKSASKKRKTKVAKQEVELGFLSEGDSLVGDSPSKKDTDRLLGADFNDEDSVLESFEVSQSSSLNLKFAVNDKESSSFTGFTLQTKDTKGKNNLDVITAPTVTTTSGNRAVVKVVDERYSPVVFEEPEISNEKILAEIEAVHRNEKVARQKQSLKRPLTKEQSSAILEKSKKLTQKQNYADSIHEIEKLLVKQPYNIEANKLLAKNYLKLRERGEARRKIFPQEKMSEITWKWSNPLNPEQESMSIMVNSRNSAPKRKYGVEENTSFPFVDNNIQISSTLNAQILSNTENGQSLNSQLKDLGLALHPQAKVTHYSEFNRLLIHNSDYLLTQNRKKITLSDKAIQISSKLEPLLKKAEKAYQEQNYQQAKEALNEALQLKADHKAAKKLLQQVEEKIQPEKKTSKLFKSTAVEPTSTFAIDVDTASYTAARRKILNGQRPQAKDIRQEEFLNYFNYNYSTPKNQSFVVESELTPSPFIKDHHILRIGVQGKRPGADNKRPSNTTFVIDTSGSMAAQSRLPLIQNILPMLLDKMNKNDQVSLITCDINSRLIADQTSIKEKAQLKESIKSLQATGATNLEQSLLQAYKHAAQNYQNEAMNRIVLISDGVANLGDTAAKNILNKVEELRKMGITITVIGMGQGNYNDQFLETLANKADGSYIYIDSYEEAKKTFVDNFSAHFQLIARDVKIQVELNPELVESYRLIGYDNRRLRNQDFRNDTVDGGEVGAGQSVTALYEIKLKGTQSTSSAKKPALADKATQSTGDAKHQLGKGTQSTSSAYNSPLGELRLRYKDPIFTHDVREINFPIGQSRQPKFQEASKSTRLATIVATFAEYLRGAEYAQGIDKKTINKLINELSIEMAYDKSVQELKKLISLTQ